MSLTFTIEALFVAPIHVRRKKSFAVEVMSFYDGENMPVIETKAIGERQLKISLDDGGLERDKL